MDVLDKNYLMIVWLAGLSMLIILLVILQYLQTSSTNVKSASAALPKSPAKKVVKQEESKKNPKAAPASTAAIVEEKEDDGSVAESQHQGLNGSTETDMQSSVSPSQTNGHSEQVDLPAEPAPQTVAVTKYYL